MPKIDAILNNRMRDTLTMSDLDNIGLLDLIYRLCQAELYHRDFHIGNIGIMFNIESGLQHFILLDFGLRTGRLSEPATDCRRSNLMYVRDLVEEMRFSKTFNFQYLKAKLKLFRDYLDKTIRDDEEKPFLEFVRKKSY